MIEGGLTFLHHQATAAYHVGAVVVVHQTGDNNGRVYSETGRICLLAMLLGLVDLTVPQTARKYLM